jgi:hypothetical protein
MNERMAYPSAEGVDLNITLERALDDASSVLRSEAARLGAEAVAVLFSAGSQVEITYSWSRLPDCAPKQHLSSIGPVRFEALKTISGPIEAGNPLAPLLRELVSLQSQSFFFFHGECNNGWLP